jgi:zinc protease
VSEAHPDYAALQIATTILGGGFLNSRLAERLRQKDGVSYGAGAFFRPDLHEDNSHSQVMLYAIYNPLNYEKVQLGFKEELDRFIREGVTEEELGNAVNGWIQEQTVSRAKDGELSGTLQNNLYFGRTMDFQQQIEARVESLTTAGIHAAIKKYIPAFDQWSVVNAGDFNATATVSE